MMEETDRAPPVTEQQQQQQHHSFIHIILLHIFSVSCFMLRLVKHSIQLQNQPSVVFFNGMNYY